MLLVGSSLLKQKKNRRYSYTIHESGIETHHTSLYDLCKIIFSSIKPVMITFLIDDFNEDVAVNS